jgi:hypothetical protein
MKLSKHQTFVIEQMARSTLVPHPKNPRTITDAARKKLRDNMKEVGLLQPIIVNRTTGYMLGGHQRLAVLDSLERYKVVDGTPSHDYLLDVSVVELDEKAEAKALVFLNNADAMGSWDLDALASLATDTDVSLESMGFDRVSLETLFDGDSRFESLLGSSAEAEDTKSALDAMRGDSDETKREEGQRLKEIKQERAGFNERRNEKADTDYYCVIVCQDAAEKAALMAHLRLPKGEQYIAPSEIMGLVRPE